MSFRPTLWLALLMLALVPAFARAQETGGLHGHAQDPELSPMANAQVQLSLDGKNAKYTFTTDQNGDYTGSGIKPGTYVAILFQTPGKAVDRALNVKITPGGNTTQDFDLSRPSYLASLPPAEQKRIEEIKKANAAIIQSNQKVGELNGLLKQARADIDQKNYDAAATLMQQAVQTKPDASVLWLTLGSAQAGQKKNDDAITSFKKALELDAASKKPNPEVQASAQNGIGSIYASTNKIPDAVVAFDAAAKLQPQNAGMYYTNEAIVLNRAGEADATVAAADKAIAANPKQPIPYYLKGQALVTKATVDPKTQKIVAPPGTVEAYNMYLQLAPNGQMAPEVQQILSQIGGKVVNKYNAHKH